MNHIFTHILIALIIMLPFMVVGYPYVGATVASAFYTGREFYQYYVLNKRHNGRFDYEGCVPVVIVTFILAWILA